MSHEKLIRRAGARLGKIATFRSTHVVTLDATVDSDGDGQFDDGPNPDTGSGVEAGVTALRAPILLAQDGPAEGTAFSPEELAESNWFEFSEDDIDEQGFTGSREIVDFVVAEVRSLREAAEG